MTEHELIEYGVSVGWLTPEKAEELKKLLTEQQPRVLTIEETIIAEYPIDVFETNHAMEITDGE